MSMPLSRWAKGLLCLLVCRALFAGPTGATIELAPLWDSAIAALQEGAHEQASERLFRWIDLAAKAGIQSAEAHYNLSQALWAMKKPGQSVYHLLESARLRASPLSSLKALVLADEIERELGIREPVNNAPNFRLCFLISPNWSLAFLALSLWLVIGCLFLWWLRGKPSTAVKLGCAIGAVAFTAIALIGTINRKYFCHFAVLDSSRSGVPVFAKPTDKEEEKLVELPPGTIVSLAESLPSEGALEPISGPVAGWVPSNALLRVRLD